MAIQRLTAAYRSRSRPSSTPGAKASTMCPSYLDGDQALLTKRPVIPVGWQPIVAIGCQLAWLCSFQGPRKALRPGLGRSVSQNSTACAHRYGLESSGRVAWPADPVEGSCGRQVRSTSLEPALSSGDAVCAAGRTGAPILELPRKEVIQPHLPVRLPCYDFTPVTSPTFDGSLPKG